MKYVGTSILNSQRNNSEFNYTQINKYYEINYEIISITHHIS